jgi:hypothetical protein
VEAGPELARWAVGRRAEGCSQLPEAWACTCAADGGDVVVVVVVDGVIMTSPLSLVLVVLK